MAQSLTTAHAKLGDFPVDALPTVRDAPLWNNLMSPPYNLTLAEIGFLQNWRCPAGKYFPPER